MKRPSTLLLMPLYLLLFLAVAWALYGSQFQRWSLFSIPGSGEDGAKNYYTVAYHIQHDSTLSWFEGMNYPEGEHVIYTDNQPLISNLLKAVGGSADWLPSLVFFSMLIGGWFLFRLIDFEGSIWWFSILASLGIVFLSPQLLRLGGHYSLAYVGVIPTFLYIVHMESQKHSILYSCLAALFVLLSGFIHPYFMVMLVLYWICIAITDQIALVKKFEPVSFFKSLGFPIASLILFRLIIFVSDPVIDRPANPYGFIHYSATWSSVFLPIDFNYFKSLASYVDQSTEGGFFIGLFALTGLVFGLIQWVKTGRKVGSLSLSVKFLLASIPVLLLAVAFPFYVWKFERLLEFVGPLRQFRGIGRFAFVFFFAANLYAATVIGKLIVRKANKKSFALAFLCLFLLGFDAYYLSEQVEARTIDGTTAFHDRLRSEIEILNVQPTEFQAIIPLPNFHVGSENFRTPEVEGVKEQSFALSLKTGLPLHAVQMSRTSLSQTLSHLELLHFLGQSKLHLCSSKNCHKPFLLLVKPDEAFDTNEEKLITYSTFIQNYRGYELRKLDPENIKQIVDENNLELSSRQSKAKPVKAAMNNYRSFDDLSSEKVFAGEGALQINRIDWTDLMPSESMLTADSMAELSFWFYAGHQQAVNTQIWLWEKRGDEEIRFEVSEVGDHLAQVRGDWILCTIPIKVESDGNQITIKAHRDGNNMVIYLDELLLRNVGQDYFRPGSLNLNNRYIEPPRT